MKNSAETKTGFSLFSINEHRLSIGLLSVFLIGAVCYGVWLLISPMLPEVFAGKAVSRTQTANTYYRNRQWDKSIGIYNEILADDPENGFAILAISMASERKLYSKWTRYNSLVEKSADADTVEAVLAEEAIVFDQAINSWKGLFDHARYRARGMERIACLHSLRFSKLKDAAELELAFDALESMFDAGYVTARGMYNTRQLTPLKGYEEFRRLAKLETRLSNSKDSKSTASFGNSFFGN